MKSFSHQNPPLRLFVGEDSLAALPRELDRLGSKRAFVFCAGSVARQPHLIRPVLDALGARCVTVFDALKAHSPIDVVEAGSEALRSVEADAVIAIGGGSAIVTARAAGILAAEGGNVADLASRRLETGRFFSPKLLAPKIPQFVVPTTPTMAIVKAASAVFDPAQGKRLPLFDPKTRAQAVFIHPALALSAPLQLALASSLNTLALAIEALEGGEGDPLSDAALLHSLRLLAENLPKMVAEPDNAEVRCELMIAAILCGQGTDHASPGVAAALGHSLGLRVEIDNGVANGILLPHTLRFNAPVTSGRLRAIAQALGAQPSDGDWVNGAVDAVKGLIADLPVPTRLRDAGVPREALPGIAELAMEDWFMERNPRRVENSTAALGILDSAW